MWRLSGSWQVVHWLLGAKRPWPELAKFGLKGAATPLGSRAGLAAWHTVQAMRPAAQSGAAPAWQLTQALPAPATRSTTPFRCLAAAVTWQAWQEEASFPR